MENHFDSDVDEDFIPQNISIESEDSDDTSSEGKQLFTLTSPFIRCNKAKIQNVQQYIFSGCCKLITSGSCSCGVVASEISSSPRKEKSTKRRKIASSSNDCGGEDDGGNTTTFGHNDFPETFVSTVGIRWNLHKTGEHLPVWGVNRNTSNQEKCGDLQDTRDEI